MRGKRRLRTAAWALVAAILASAGGLLAVGWYFSDQLLTPNHTAPIYNLLVHNVTRNSIELDRTSDTIRRGIWGLEWVGGHAIVGAVTATSETTVTRVLQRTTAPMHPGLRVVVSSQVYWLDPEQSFGIVSRTIKIPSDTGLLPAWYVPGRSRDFAIVVHGYNASMTDGERLVPALAGLGLPVVLIDYRNDVDAPASADHLMHLGDTEWRDLESTARWALSQGAQQIVLVGISMGGAVVEMFMQRSSLAKRVVAAVLDSPVLDWDAVLRFQAARRHLPDIFVASTEIVIRLRIGFDVSSYNLVRDAAAMKVPTLLYQDGQDALVPPGVAAELATARPGLVEYHLFSDAGHAEEWNVDPSMYDDTLHSFLLANVSGSGALGSRGWASDFDHVIR
jgi:uncharacterized protein